VTVIAMTAMQRPQSRADAEQMLCKAHRADASTVRLTPAESHGEAIHITVGSPSCAYEHMCNPA
jgi:hypothetical protein